MKELIKKINELAKIKKERALTEKELNLKKSLYTQYLSLIRAQVKNHLNNVEIVDDTTTKSTLTKKTNLN